MLKPVRRPLNAPFLRWAHSVVRDRCHIRDRAHFQSAGLDGANSGFAARARAFDEHIHFLHAVFFGIVRCLLSNHPRRVRRALAAALEACCSRAGPGDHVALLIAHRDDRVVERRLNVCLPVRDILSDFLWPTTWPLASASHLSLFLLVRLIEHPGTAPQNPTVQQRRRARLPYRSRALHPGAQRESYFFLAPRRRPRPATVFFGPRLVRALVLVRCPWAGKLRRWRKPR